MANDLVKNGRVGKFLLDRRTPSAPRVYFINTQYQVDGEVPDYALFHWPFARRVLQIPETIEEFNAATYFTEAKRFVAGVLHTYYLDGSTEPIFGMQAYPQDVIRESMVVESLRPVIEKINIPGARFAFVQTGSQQTVATVTQELADLGVEVLTLDRILGAVAIPAADSRRGLGHLRIFPSDLRGLGPPTSRSSIELPGSLCGLRRADPRRARQQLPCEPEVKGASHPERRAPKRSPGQPQLAPYADRPTHLVVAKDGLTLEPTTEEVIVAKLAERLDRPLTPLTWESEDELRSTMRWPGNHRHHPRVQVPIRLEGGQPGLPGPSRRSGTRERPGQCERPARL